VLLSPTISQGIIRENKEETMKIKTYSGNIVPEPDTIFVFGSNPEGVHGAGSAKVARLQFGAIYGQGEGLQGNAYGLPTTILNYDSFGWVPYSRKMTMEEITEHIKKMYECARQHPDKKFKVAYRNQPDEVTLCGYSGREMMSCFKNACCGDYPENVYFSEEWGDSGCLVN
jgi:hypothetical protein